VILPHTSRVGEDATAAVDLALDRGALLVSAEAIGAMQVMLDDTTGYLKQRVQFGQPLATFQVLRHRLVDMALALEEARAALDVAVAGMGENPARRGEGVAVAKIISARSARLVSQQAV
jgi:alkylation response protein AidB-like acyl-CoA dehydrogenase